MYGWNVHPRILADIDIIVCACSFELFLRDLNFFVYIFVSVFIISGSDTGSINRLVNPNNLGLYDSITSSCVTETEEVVLNANDLIVGGKQQDNDGTKMDLSDLDLDLDEVVVSIVPDRENNLVPLSASRLRLLQDTTVIESALDLDSLEESTSSVGTDSQAGLLRKKESL